MLKVGGSSITIKPDGITIAAPKITLDAKATVEIKGTAKVDVQGAMVQVAADATLILKGALTKIN